MFLSKADGRENLNSLKLLRQVMLRMSIGARESWFTANFGYPQFSVSDSPTEKRYRYKIGIRRYY